jgi:ribonuclease HI
VPPAGPQPSPGGAEAARSAGREPPDEVELWTDGACSGNPGPGGWAALLRWRGHERELSGGDPQTTNNRMELMGLIEGLRALQRPSRVAVHTDSSYIERAITDGWLRRWQANGWKTSARKDVANRDLWEALAELAARHELRMTRVKGHAGVALNERVDQLAVAARDRAARR